MAGEVEHNKCSVCGKEGPVLRKYFRYDIDCDCCVGDHHFHFVYHCNGCEPKEPETTKISLLTSTLHKIQEV